ncbi:glutathione peroxidase 2-like [Apostichopus japonicus]|uniref:glutathione peroxidase 2-like n=1 Tax=Stichopus japonicus TaxID=307972 RepID=UPI003AB206C0
MFRGLLSPIFLVVLTDTLRVTESTLHVGNGNLSRCYDDATSIHTFTPVDIDNEPVKLSDYEGKVLLIVNVASFCTFTSQYHDLTKLKKMTDLEDKFEVLAFPCNQFGYQEPGENKYEIMNCLKYARPGYGYAPNFPIFSKIEVNGKDEIGLFTHLKESCPPVKLEIGDKDGRFWTPFRVNDITWNFNKFLIDQHGVPYKRYDSKVEPLNIAKDIRELVKEK